MDDPHFEMTYGSDKVEVMNYNGVSFENNGKYYSMFSWEKTWGYRKVPAMR